MKSFLKFSFVALLVVISVTLVGCGGKDKGWYYLAHGDGGATFQIGDRPIKGLFNDDLPKVGAPSGEIILIKGQEDDVYRVHRIIFNLAGQDFSPSYRAKDLTITSGEQLFGDGTEVRFSGPYTTMEGKGTVNPYYTAQVLSTTGAVFNLEQLDWELDITKDVTISFSYEKANGDTQNFELTIKAK